MADLAHLEKMGRELKCPICLSLLKSAVSLTCNHVFCNLCITESMKSVSDCPVCKVPFRRREVRPAPHMDNLVSVFKSMEVTAGVNIFTTQVAPTTKNSGDEEKKSDTRETIVTRRGKSKTKAKANNSRQKSEEADIRTSNERRLMMPSFPAKKRVHVTPFPASETPSRPEKVCKLGNTSIESEANKALDENKKVGTEEEENRLSPFFWLREEDDDEEAPEKPSAQLTVDSSQPNNAPCFSDIKDTDDEKTPTKMTATSSRSNVAEAFDSEIFEWTQRACSPELCSTPLKKQTAGRNELYVVQEMELQKTSQTGMPIDKEVSHSECEKNTNNGQSNLNRGNGKTISAKKETLKKRKKPNYGNQPSHSKSSDHTMSDKALNEMHAENLADYREIAEGPCQENGDNKQKEPRSRGRISNKRGEKSSDNHQKTSDAVIHKASEQLITKSVKVNTQTTEREERGSVLPSLTCHEPKTDIAVEMQSKTNKRGKKVAPQSKRKHMKSSMADDGISNMLEDVPANTLHEAKKHDQEHQKLNIGLQASPSKQGISKGSGNSSPRSSPEIQKKAVSKSKAKQRKNETADVAMDDNIRKIPVGSEETVGCERDQMIINRLESASLTRNRLSRSNEFLLDDGDKTLRKCGNLHSQIRCVFCQSSNNTKDSGEMMHYFNGKPVAADCNGGVHVVHSHKHCTEWAPDVYFEDDLAVNLAAEITRSRRIKCSCCGIKGAALGCYEKSCRKSFHFTCAKLIPECQWDNDNFVMLCPAHSSCKLPSEASQPHRQRRKIYTPKAKLQAPACKTSHEISRRWTWPCGSPCKWLFCCSALTAAEKEIISEFTRLTGVPISKSWSPAVTHVIASTDENGACRRTLKFLMGILDGKWILSIEWIKACMKAMEPVDEENFEITVDAHGIRGGPRLGRLRAFNKEPKLFHNFRFYLAAEFIPSYKGYLQDLVIAAGGAVLQRKPITRDQGKLFDSSSIFMIYSIEPPKKNKSSSDAVVFDRRRAEAQALADVCGAKVATNSWIIDSIAASKLQPLT